MAKKNLAELLIDTLAAAGVKRVCGLAGDSLNGITDVIRTDERIKWIHVRHEETAAFAAKSRSNVQSATYIAMSATVDGGALNMSTHRAPSNEWFPATAIPFIVLCVDDKTSVLNLRQLILKRKRYLVSTANTASEALAIFNSGDVDIVITEHLLGRAEGKAMVKEMKRLKPHVPIVVLSGTAKEPEGIEIVDAFLGNAETEFLWVKLDELAIRSRR
jgi:CheY-like chemotaxis protein